MLFTDHLNNTINLTAYPKRVISLVPSQSELLWDLGLREELIGITKFCIHPDEMFKTVERVGGTKTLNLDKIHALKPDLIIGNKEENDQLQIIELQKEFPVWMSDIFTLEDALNMILLVGELVNKSKEAFSINQKIHNSFLEINTVSKTVLYLIWNNPYMAAGENTFIADMLRRIGLKNVLSNQERYPQLSMEQIQDLNPEIVFLSSEPYPFKESHIEELQHFLPKSKIVLVDGELFSWYGSRLTKSVTYFNCLTTSLVF